MFINLFDSHVHSDNSPDGLDSVETMAKTAIERGFQGMVISDHCEIDFYQEEECWERQQGTARDVARIKELLAGKLDLTLGIELGQPDHGPELAEQMLAAHPFDMVLLSVHRIKGWEDPYYMDYAKLSLSQIDAFMDGLLDTMLDYISWADFDVLAHITFPLRSAVRNSNVRIDLKRHAHRVDEVLRLLIQKGKALEVNVSGLRGKLGETMPPAWVFSRYRELGGELVTIGSDAHKSADMGLPIQRGMEILLDAGFRYFAFYKNRKPQMHKLA